MQQKHPSILSGQPSALFALSSGDMVPAETVTAETVKLGMLSNTLSQNAMLADTAAGTTPEASFPSTNSIQPGHAVSGLGTDHLNALLVSIGRELARHNIGVDAALQAGWLGTLSITNIALLRAVHAHEMQLLAIMPVQQIPQRSQVSMPPNQHEKHLEDIRSQTSSCLLLSSVSPTDTSLSTLPLPEDLGAHGSSLAHSAPAANGSTSSAFSSSTIDSVLPQAAHPAHIVHRSDSKGFGSKLAAASGSPAGASSSSSECLALGAAPSRWGPLLATAPTQNGVLGAAGVEAVLAGAGGSHPSLKAASGIDTAEPQELAARFTNLHLGCGFF
ncbi:hypothetical protein V8C86DRAFT_2432595 [Haematococcus lacustris]